MRGVGALAVAGATAAGLLVAVPILLPCARLASSGATRPIEMVSQLSATPAGYVTSTSLAHAWWNGRIVNDVNVWFAGVAAIALATLGLARGAAGDGATRRRTVTLIVLAAVGLLLSLGPATSIYRWSVRRGGATARSASGGAIRHALPARGGRRGRLRRGLD